ncbi:TetR/AcrR family transcriptional regulator [Gordonia terrae]|uniref:TetR/AcrR family transcriptional regulator n=1 Tax=Gordonia terrae TaxID=2055 RepID=UPI003F6BAF26
MARDWLVGGDRADAARDRLVAHAAALIGRRGLDAFDLDELGRRAHCSRATIYRHAGGRAALIEAVFATTSAPVLDEIRSSTTGLVGEERARKVIVETLRALRQDRVIRQFLAPRSLMDATPTVLASPTVLAVAADLTGIDAGDTASARLVIRSVLGLLLWPGEPAEEADLVNAVVAGVFRRDPGPLDSSTDDTGPHP